MRRVFVTGMGIISPLGTGVRSNLQNLIEGKTGISKASFFDSNYAEELPFAEVKLSNSELRKKANKQNEKGRTRTDLLAHIAISEALLDANLSESELRNIKTGIISASTVEGMGETDRMYEDANDPDSSSEFIRSYDFGAHTIKLAEEFGIVGYRDSINTACSSSANAILLGKKLIQSGMLDRVIVGGSDCLSKYSANGFNALRILSDEACRPFDENRKGLNLGEGAAYLVLEAEGTTKDKRVYAEIKGAGNANDAFHASATSEEARGPILAMKKAIEDGDLDPKQIDYINAHGTGTENNDLTESIAFKYIFKDRVPAFSSTKCYTGHTLGAAGAIEALFSILSIQENRFFCALNFFDAIEKTNLRPIMNQNSDIQIRNTLSNSFGFGGNCTSLLISKL